MLIWHTDGGALTILHIDDTPDALQVKLRNGEWIYVNRLPGTFIINIGDMMMRWTNDRWVSNPHRVINPPEAAARTRRLSIAFFHHPNYDALIECIAPPGEARYAPVLSGAYRDEKYRQTRLSQQEQAP